MRKESADIIFTMLKQFVLERPITKEEYPTFFGEGYEKGDENSPFFSECCLYNLVGKEDARTILSLIRRLAEVAGVSKDIILSF